MTIAQRITKRVEGSILKAKQNLAKAILTQVVVDTPVLTGAAKSSWIVSDQQPTDEKVMPSQTSPDTANALAITRGSMVIDKCKFSGVLYIQNNQPYIGLLNRGSSVQAPPYFVQKAVNISVNR